jgi:integrase/recombinase XerD
MWESHKKGYKAWLQLEKSLSEHSVSAYLHDVEMLTSYLTSTNYSGSPDNVDRKTLELFVKTIHELGMSDTSQARIISGLRSFFKYCLLEQICLKDPTELLESPKLRRKLPDTLSFNEIESIISSIDLSKDEGTRNQRTLFGCWIY